MAIRTRRASAGFVGPDSGLGNSQLPGGGPGDVDGFNHGPGPAPDLGSPILLDPTTIIGGEDGSVSDSGDTVASGPEPRRRGRKPGSTNKAKASVTVGGIEKALYGIHFAVSKAVGDHWKLDHEESKLLAESLAAVQSHYPALEIPPQYLDIGALFSVAAAIYGPRILVGRIRANKARAVPTAATAPGPATPMAEPVIFTPAPVAQPAAAPKRGMAEIPGVGIINIGDYMGSPRK